MMNRCETVDKAGTSDARPNSRRWGADSKRDPVARAAAEQLGLSEHFVEKMVRAKTGLNIRCAEIIKAFRALGDDVRLERFFEPIRRAYENRRPEALTLKLVESVNEACHAEHVAELRYLANRSDADLSLEIRALHRAIAQMRMLVDAAEAEEQHRMTRQS